jgi:hypothetical protein
MDEEHKRSKRHWFKVLTSRILDGVWPPEFLRASQRAKAHDRVEAWQVQTINQCPRQHIHQEFNFTSGIQQSEVGMR